MQVSVVLRYEDDGKSIPLARSHNPALIHDVARSICKELRELPPTLEGDRILTTLARQEAERVENAFRTLYL